MWSIMCVLSVLLLHLCKAMRTPRYVSNSWGGSKAGLQKRQSCQVYSQGFLQGQNPRGFCWWFCVSPVPPWQPLSVQTTIRAGSAQELNPHLEWLCWEPLTTRQWWQLKQIFIEKINCKCGASVRHETSPCRQNSSSSYTLWFPSFHFILTESKSMETDDNYYMICN